MRTKTIRKRGTVQKVFKWTEKAVKKVMSEIAKNEKVEIVYLTKTEGMGGYNYGSSAGNSIMLAPFIKVKAGEEVDGIVYPHACDNPLECQFITFFHELSHIKFTKKVPSIVKGYAWNDTSQYQFELWITMLGVEYAHKKYGIKFSDSAVKWLLDEAVSYTGNNNDIGYELKLMNQKDGYYEVKSQWEFTGDQK